MRKGVRQVSPDEFYAVIGPLDVALLIVNDHPPYRTEFRLKPKHQVVGWQDVDGKYYLVEEAKP